MPLDDRLNTELRQLAPSDPSGAYERVVEKRVRRQVARRIQAGVVAVAVFGFSLAGVLVLGRSIGPGPADALTPTGMLLFQRYVRCPDRPDVSTWGLEVMALDVATGDLRAVSWGETLHSGAMRSEEWPDASPDGRSFVWIDRYEKDVFITNIARGDTERLTHGLTALQPRFSPDGARILFEAGSGPDGRGIYTMAPDGTDLTFLGQGSDPTWANDGRIAFLSGEQGDSTASFFLMDSDGTNVELVYEAPNDVHFGRAEWSPDGSRIVADATVNGNTDIYVLDLDTQIPVRLTDDPAEDTSPTWSPDGEWIAFHTGRWGTELGHGELALIRADGSGLRRLTNDCYGDFMPSWVENDSTLRSLPMWTEPPLPDLGEPSAADPGDILVSGRTLGFSDLFAVDPSTGEIRNLTADHVAQFSPAWSPDHERIVFEGDLEDDGSYDLYIVDREGSDLTRLTDTAEQEGRPAWSPDGTRIAFEADDGVSIIDVEGSDTHHVAGTSSVGGSYPTWSPDSSQIAFTQQGEIWVVGADGSNPHVVLSAPGDEPFGVAYDVSWSPDGGRLLFICERQLCSWTRMAATSSDWLPGRVSSTRRAGIGRPTARGSCSMGCRGTSRRVRCTS